ncbi:hypothetical protein [Bradyrhizobium sp. AUGA SZCCT0283]|uniref:hypothetical protein n=1 Tax=Bradyrhizobium sp. AUGA SZCCT0283 TaxID=2807671 RepID=UPI001BA84449|nr:hypothetical protein [Bradyrhizobium sp. AUGA SZCCT0283]MBR1276109.1 hypothetical protein [Bradyrhizobium sp. AUGA SZCCT0283]
MTAQLLHWHKPKIVDLGIHVSPKKNTWRNFLHIIDEHFTSHQLFPIVYPKVETIKTIIFKNRLGSRDRMGELRARRRAKKDKRDPVEFRQVPLPRSVISKLEAKLNIDKAHDAPVTDKQWRKLIDDVIASIVVEKVTGK